MINITLENIFLIFESIKYSFLNLKDLSNNNIRKDKIPSIIMNGIKEISLKNNTYKIGVNMYNRTHSKYNRKVIDLKWSPNLKS